MFVDGKLLIKNLPGEKENLFEISIVDYYNNQAHIEENPTKKDLSRMKFALSWLVNNRNSFNVFYLKDFNSAEEILNKLL